MMMMMINYSSLRYLHIIDVSRGGFTIGPLGLWGGNFIKFLLFQLLHLKLENDKIILKCRQQSTILKKNTTNLQSVSEAESTSA